MFSNPLIGQTSGGGTGQSGNWDGVVKLRGLPFKSTQQDVEDFLQGLTWAANGIFFPNNAAGESTGEAFVQFDTFENANTAMSRNKECIGGRYIELFKSSNSEMRRGMIQDARARKDQVGNKNPSYAARQKTGGGTWAGLNLSAGASMHMHQNSQFNGGQTGNMGQSMGGNMGGLNIGNMGHGMPQNMGNSGFAGNGDMGGTMNQNNVSSNGAAAGSIPVPGQNRPAPYQKPPVPQATQVVTAANNSPFPHVVGVQGIEAGIVNSQIQEFFKPAKAIAINMLGNGYCDVAFKTHEDALQAMEKDRMPIQGSAINLTLKSQPAGQGWSNM